MEYKVCYSYGSDKGLKRSINQDNLIADCKYLNKGTERVLSGRVERIIRRPLLLGVFDGMGGEQNGEDASFIAAESASRWNRVAYPDDKLEKLILAANKEICRFADEQGLQSVGTTAAMLIFTQEDIIVSNIGDSKIFYMDGDRLCQVSEDDVFPPRKGFGKPPLMQCLGIPPEEMIIEPHISHRPYVNGQRYLICSDGLTDMVRETEICEVLKSFPVEYAVNEMINRALEHGGNDNVTVIVCEVCLK